MKIVFISLNVKPGFEFVDADFFKKLKKKINIKFCAILQSYYKKGGLYSYGKKFINNTTFKKLNTKWLKFNEEIKIEIIKHDIIILSPIHGSNEFVDFAKSLNKKVIIIDSGFNYDFYRRNNSDLIFFKGENSLKIHSTLNPKFPKKNIFLESCLQSEYIKNKYLDNKAKFLKKYRIKKEYVLFLPTGPQYHNQRFKEKYYDICKYLIKKNFHVVLKLHPTEHNTNKVTSNYNNSKSSDMFMNHKNLSICKQEDFYSAVKNAKHIFSTHTTAYVEVNLLQR